MDLFFVNSGNAKRYLESLVISGDDVARLLDDRAIADGTPIFLDGETMMPVEPMSSWGRTLAYAALKPGTRREYGRIVARLSDYQEKRGRNLVTATESDIQAFKRVRTELQKRPLGDSAWGKECQLLDRFYGHLVRVGAREHLPVRMGAMGRNPMAPRIRQRMNIRHLALDQYRYLRDVGLGGQQPDSAVDLSFRGWAPHRNRGGADLALGTGMRWQEWATVLLPELGIGVGYAVDDVVFTVQACAKYGKARKIYVPSDSMSGLEPYLLLERPEQSATSARRLERRHRDLFVVSRVDHDSGLVYGLLDGMDRVFSMSGMEPWLRRIAVRETEVGLEAMAVFICHSGLMPGADSWKRYRHGAWRRMVAWANESTPVLPRQRWRWHDLRHTFALQLLSYLERQMDGEEPDALARRRRHRSYLSSHMRLNPLLIVSRRLGHSSPATTFEYLEYADDSLNQFDDAFRGWVGEVGHEATYAQIASHAFGLDKKESV
ncbi:hypothetical protein [Streptomyces fildesensis]|uniref:hypothetical protein n=1 Tax=Streptomyces fildesensis TaxID=375757 RepID=UPI0018DFE2E1|nr:hypothetical protein [Streptomyces fildesensis]